MNLSPGETSTTVTWLQPQATDPSGINVISNFESGDVFSPGSSEVRYIFIDGAGNQASCNFVVEVVMAQGKGQLLCFHSLIYRMLGCRIIIEMMDI